MPFAVSRVSLDDVTWSPVLAPMDCETVILSCEEGATVTVRTDAADADTALPILGGTALTLSATAQPSLRSGLFLSGARVCYAKAAAGAATLLLQWLGAQHP